MSKLNDSTAATGHLVGSQAESARMLTDRPVLVVETEFIIALGIQSVLETLGANLVLLSSSAADAHTATPSWTGAALAVIELETNRPDLVELAREVSMSGIPVLGISADPRLSFGVPELPGTPVVIKPVPDEDLARAILARLNQNPLPEVT
jgi:CheY-like chemotaxis protein